MVVGVSGHQAREGIDWNWVQRSIGEELRRVAPVRKALSSLAAGTDQLFCEVALSLGIPVVAVIPLDGYDEFFDADALTKYRELLARCDPLELHLRTDPERAFLEAGRLIVEKSDLLIVVWDGEEAEGVGGTGDIVRFAEKVRRRIIHLNPCTETIERR